MYRLSNYGIADDRFYISSFRRHNNSAAAILNARLVFNLNFDLKVHHTRMDCVTLVFLKSNTSYIKAKQYVNRLQTSMFKFRGS